MRRDSELKMSADADPNPARKTRKRVLKRRLALETSGRRSMRAARWTGGKTAPARSQLMKGANHYERNHENFKDNILKQLDACGKSAAPSERAFVRHAAGVAHSAVKENHNQH